VLTLNRSLIYILAIAARCRKYFSLKLVLGKEIWDMITLHGTTVVVYHLVDLCYDFKLMATGSRKRVTGMKTSGP
jgi:hypothetical protein